MRTEKHIAASRLNGRKSSARIVAANLKSGVYAESEILPWEEAESLDRLEAEYYDHHRPASPEARLLLDDLILCEWTLRRLHRADSNLWELSAREAWRPDPDYAPAQAFKYSDKTFTRLQHRFNGTRLAIHRTIKDLRNLEASEASLARTCPNASSPTPGTSGRAPTPETVSQHPGQDLSQVKDRSSVPPPALGSLRKSPSGPGAPPETTAEKRPPAIPRSPAPAFRRPLTERSWSRPTDGHRP
jgi:hypothetical protein